jgi:hypothetical protein
VHGIKPSAIYLRGVLGCLHPRVAPIFVASMECAGGTVATGNNPSGSLSAQGNYLTVSFILQFTIKHFTLMGELELQCLDMLRRRHVHT